MLLQHQLWATDDGNTSLSIQRWVNFDPWITRSPVTRSLRPAENTFEFEHKFSWCFKMKFHDFSEIYLVIFSEISLEKSWKYLIEVHQLQNSCHWNIQKRNNFYEVFSNLYWHTLQICSSLSKSKTVWNIYWDSKNYISPTYQIPCHMNICNTSVKRSILTFTISDKARVP